MVPLDWPGCRQTVQDRLGGTLGSVRQLVDDSAVVVLARDYTPFGLVRSGMGTVAQHSGYGFTGEQVAR